MRESSSTNVFYYIKSQICLAIKEGYDRPNRPLGKDGELDLSAIVAELPKDKSHGDFSTNAAIVIANKLKLNPKELAETLKAKLLLNQYFSKVQVAGPGFINIEVSFKFWTDFINAVYANPDEFGRTLIGLNKKVLIEFVSANPTGPMHVGHSRGAIYGDALANLLKASGFTVTKEYYINDAGNQIKTLAQSLFIRYQQLFGIESEVFEGMYPGDYLIKIAEEIKAEYGDHFLSKPDGLEELAVDKIMEIIRADLKKLGVLHDSFISELHDLHKTDYIQKAIAILQNKGLLYKGILEAPKGHVQEDWERKEQTLFKSTEFGDDIDRAVARADGSYTYFAGDFGLALQRLDRGFKDVIMVLGADHTGFVKRIKAITKALSDGKSTVDLPITQMVNLFKDGQPFKMSKRSGNFITAEDVVDEVGLDVLRFVLLSRKNDTVIDFDFDKVKEQTKENPVFYVQYAHARCSSVLVNALNEYAIKPDLSKLDLLNTSHDADLIRKVSLFPRIVEQAALTHEPHRLIYYLIELATEFHSFWSKGGDDIDLRFIIPNNPDLTSARLVLVDLVKLTIKLALKMLGIKAMDRM